jgi:broad-specificity NMP kinase
MKHIIIRGPLGVGKSTIARKLSTTLNYEYISLDQVIDDNKLVPPGVEGVPLESFLEANKLLLQYAEHSEKPLLIDGCFYHQEQLDDLVAKLGRAVTIFTLICSVEECIERDSKRKKVYGEDAARFVYMMTSNVKAGLEIDTTNLSADETIAIIMREL